MLLAVSAVVAFGMEEIYAKFVSQKISKTRWRPVPPGSLQTAETFATGSWDNEVPPFPGRKFLPPPSLLEPRRPRSARELSPSSFSLLLPPPSSCLRLGCPVPQPSMVCLSLESLVL